MIAIGYSSSLVLPLQITPQDRGKPVTLQLKLDYAVCEKLCVPAEAKVELVLDVRPDVVSFTFGCPSDDVFRRLADRGVLSLVTVTSVAEAQVAPARGAASLGVQGPHAGGHRGTWDLEVDPDRTPLFDLERVERAEGGEREGRDRRRSEPRTCWRMKPARTRHTERL